MDFNEAAVFVRVVQAGSFSAADRQLGLPTSTVSTRVSRLERRLGAKLLQRTTRRLRLTEAGDLYYRHASIGLAHMLAAEAAVSASGLPGRDRSREGSRARLRLGTNPRNGNGGRVIAG